MVNADVNAAAAIDGSKINPTFGAQAISGASETLTTYMAVGATPATSGLIRVPHNNTVLAGRNSTNATDYQLVGWGNNGTDEVVFGNVTTRTQILGSTVATQILTYGGIPATAGEFRVRHNYTVNGRNSANSANRNIWNWGATATDTLTIGDVNAAVVLNGSGYTLNAASLSLAQGLGGTMATTGNVRIPSVSWSMIARNNSNTTDVNVIRCNSSANVLIFGDTNWGNVTLQGPSISLNSGGVAGSLGTTGFVLTGANAAQSQLQWSSASVTPAIFQAQAATNTVGNNMSITAQKGGSGGNNNGGNLTLSAGAGAGTGVRGDLSLVCTNLSVTATVAATATAGGGALPAAPQEFLTVSVNGNARKIPLYLT